MNQYFNIYILSLIYFWFHIPGFNVIWQIICFVSFSVFFNFLGTIETIFASDLLSAMSDFILIKFLIFSFLRHLFDQVIYVWCYFIDSNSELVRLLRDIKSWSIRMFSLKLSWFLSFPCGYYLYLRVSVFSLDHLNSKYMMIKWNCFRLYKCCCHGANYIIRLTMLPMTLRGMLLFQMSIFCKCKSLSNVNLSNCRFDGVDFSFDILRRK